MQEGREEGKMKVLSEGHAENSTLQKEKDLDGTALRLQRERAFFLQGELVANKVSDTL